MDVAIYNTDIFTILLSDVESSHSLHEFYKIRVCVHVKKMFNRVSLHF